MFSLMRRKKEKHLKRLKQTHLSYRTQVCNFYTVYILNCKEWARKVVLDVSMGSVNLPQTLPDANGWYWASSPYTVRTSTPIQNVKPGWILQMNWRLNNGTVTPHTAIVIGTDPYGIYLAESNVVAVNTVSTRYVTYAQFNASIVRWSVYYIL